MQWGNKITGKATFSFDFFSRSSHIAFCCIKCNAIITLDFNFFANGTRLNDLKESTSESFAFLLHNNWISLENEKYKILNLEAEYAIASCENCYQKYSAVFGMGELQPGREEIILKGIWELI